MFFDKKNWLKKLVLFVCLASSVSVAKFSSDPSHFSKTLKKKPPVRNFFSNSLKVLSYSHHLSPIVYLYGSLSVILGSMLMLVLDERKRNIKFKQNRQEFKESKEKIIKSKESIQFKQNLQELKELHEKLIQSYEKLINCVLRGV